MKRRIRAGLISLVSLVFAGTGPAQVDYERPVLQDALAVDIPSSLRSAIPDNAEASLILRIGTDGRVVDWVALAVPHYALVEALGTALMNARFSPPMIDGKPAMADVRVTLPIGDANRSFVVALDGSAAFEEYHSRLFPGPNALRVWTLKDLDDGLEMISRGEPKGIRDESGRVLTGSVSVEFYVDATGQPRLVRPDPECHPLLQGAAQLAVYGMVFAPPRVNGKPAIVTARMRIDFN